MDRRTDARPLHYAFRYERGQRNDINDDNKMKTAEKQ